MMRKTLSPSIRTGWYVAAGAALVAAGCASIVSGTRQNVAFVSTPPGAQITVDGQTMGSTPVVMKLARKNDHQVRIALDGYQPYELQLGRSVNGWYFGNIVFGGIIGLVVDAVNGAMYKLSPADINAALAQQGAEIEERDGALYIGVVMMPEPDWQLVGRLIPSR